jgi:magnesium transporter
MVDEAPPRRYPLETAGHLALRRVPIVPQSNTVGDARHLMRTADFETVDLILLTGPGGRHTASVELRALVEHDDATPLATISRPDWPAIPAAMDQEDAAAIAIREKLTVLPVVDGDGRPVGLLAAHTLIDVLGREHREDVHLMAGILREREGARHALEDPPLSRVARRLPWLLAGLALSSAATGVMASFEKTLQSNVMIAFFIPAIVYLADAVGTQTEAIAVRGLSTRKQSLIALLWSEVLTGAIIGLILGLLAFAGVWIVFGSISVATGVGVSLFAAGAIASGIGLLFPWALGRIGLDPAFGAGPVATIVQDVLTIMIYFIIMTKVIGLAG